MVRIQYCAVRLVPNVQPKKWGRRKLSIRARQKVQLCDLLSDCPRCFWDKTRKQQCRSVFTGSFPTCQTEAQVSWFLTLQHNHQTHPHVPCPRVSNAKTGAGGGCAVREFSWNSVNCAGPGTTHPSRWFSWAASFCLWGTGKTVWKGLCILVAHPLLETNCEGFILCWAFCLLCSFILWDPFWDWANVFPERFHEPHRVSWLASILIPSEPAPSLGIGFGCGLVIEALDTWNETSLKWCSSKSVGGLHGESRSTTVLFVQL